MEEIYRWWVDEGPIYSARYESKIYPDGAIPKLTGEFFERDGDERRGWLKLFILACTYTMSWSDLERQKTFLDTCQRRGWLEIFSNPDSSADEWIDVLESYFSGQIEETKWHMWIKQFVNIYQVSKHLDDYVNSFLSIEYRRGPISLNTKPLSIRVGSTYTAGRLRTGSRRVQSSLNSMPGKRTGGTAGWRSSL